MLPYRLRPPVFGSKLKHLKDDAGDAFSSGGGPVQRAVERDLHELRRSFQLLLQEEKQKTQQQSSPEPSSSSDSSELFSMEHCESGKIFGIFKNLMKKSKLALLHTFAPPRCDRGAFSQLIYSSCLSMLKSSFKTETFSLEDAAYAIFVLYTLFQTNPMPRTTQSDLELLPLKLYSQENPKFLFRRTFAPNIRIDRYHYSLLLRLRDNALVRQEECRSTCMKAFAQYMLANSALNESDGYADHKWTCTCGIAKDINELVDRLMPVLDLCEYTGPVSLEGLAGHAEYPFSFSKQETEAIPKVTKNVEPPSDLELPKPVGVVLPSEMERLMDQYQSSLKFIRIPDNKSHASIRIREALDPLFSHSKQESWTEVKNRIFPPTRAATNEPTAASTRNMVRINSPDRVETTNTQAETTSITNDRFVKVSAPADDGTTGSSYELLLPNGLSEAVRSTVQRSLDILIQRDSSVLLAPVDQSLQSCSKHATSKNSAADDVSTIGHGGISVATGQGRAALQALLSTIQEPDIGIPRIATVPKRSLRGSLVGRPGDSFLTMDKHQGSNVMNDDESSSSDVSNLSFQSDDSEEDEISVATSAMGYQALETLVSKACKPKSPPRKRRNAKKKTRRSNKTQIAATLMPRRPNNATASSQDDESFATSVAQGKTALELLLARANDEANESEEEKSIPLVHPQDENSLGDSTFGQGRAALGALLAQVDRSQPRANTARSRRKQRPRLKSVDASQALKRKKLDTSQALKRKQYDSAESVSQSNKNKRVRRVLGTEKLSSKTHAATTSDEDGSIATSVGQGRAALVSLLAHIDQESLKQKPGAGQVGRTVEADESVATSVEQGKSALSALLEHVEQKEVKHKSVDRIGTDSTGEDSSVAMSVGKGSASEAARI